MAKSTRDRELDAAARRLSEKQVGLVRRGDRGLIGISYAGEVIAHTTLSERQLRVFAEQAITMARQIAFDRAAAGTVRAITCSQCGSAIERTTTKGRWRYCTACRDDARRARQRRAQKRRRDRRRAAAQASSGNTPCDSVIKVTRGEGRCERGESGPDHSPESAG